MVTAPTTTGNSMVADLPSFRPESRNLAFRNAISLVARRTRRQKPRRPRQSPQPEQIRRLPPLAPFRRQVDRIGSKRSPRRDAVPKEPHRSQKAPNTVIPEGETPTFHEVVVVCTCAVGFTATLGNGAYRVDEHLQGKGAQTDRKVDTGLRIGRSIRGFSEASLRRCRDRPREVGVTNGSPSATRL